MIRNTKAITALSYLSMFSLGIAASLIGAAARNIGLSPYQIGLMIAVQNIGFMISVMVTGALADTHEKPRILFLGSLILGVSFLAFYQTGWFGLNLLIMGLIGIGIGAYEGVTDAMLLDIHTRRETLHININHFFVTFGSIIITTYLIFLQMNWRNATIQSGLFVLILAALFAITRLNRVQKDVQPYRDRLNFLLRERLMVAIFIATILVIGAEAGTVGILTTYLMDMRAFTQVTSKVGLVVFLSGMAVGRVLLGVITPKEQLSRYILVLFGFAVIVFTALFSLDSGNLVYGLIFLAGLAISALLPLMLTLTGLVYKDMAGTALGA
ncbi:MAG TPA: MFS transporter, partial [Anaerolineales bacterium]|nr:MFS transporter [Anaerolineales bacterium]